MAGKTVILSCKDDPDHLNGAPFIIEDWQINVFGKSWMFCDGNPAALKYAIRSSMAGLPLDNEVVYGKDARTGLGHIVHISELTEAEEKP